MKKSTRFSPEVRERAVRMVVEVTGQHDSQRPVGHEPALSVAPVLGKTL